MINKTCVKFLKSIGAVLLSLVMLMGQMTILPLNKTVSAADLSTEAYIKKLMDQGIMFGDQFGNMEPDRSITRAEFVAMVNRAFGLRETSEVKFSDIKGDEWYADDINIAKTAGYFSGAEKNKALPDKTLTREQAAALVFRNMHYDKAAPETFLYSDSTEFSPWGRPAINTATQKGFVSGYSDGSFRPTQEITRGEVAKMLSVAIGDQITGGEKSLGNSLGNVTIVDSGATLRNTTVNGDLHITEGVGLGFTKLDNVTVTGQVIVSGAGASNAGDSSILFNDCNIGSILVDGPEDKTVALRMDGSTNIQETKVKSSTTIEEYSNHANGFHNIIMMARPKSTLHLLGDFDKVTLLAPENFLYVDSGSVAELIVDEEAPDSEINLYEDTYTDKLYLDIPTEVVGDGDIGYLRVNAPDCIVESLPDTIDITPGITAKINGKEMTSKEGIQASSQPKILSKYPEMDDIAPTSAKLIYKTNKQGTIYYAVTLEDEDKLTEEEILKPANVKSILRSGKTKINAETELIQNVSGLKVNTEYRINAVLVDERDDKSEINRESFTTVDNVIPAYASGYPKINSTTNTSMEAAVVPTKDVTIYWAVLLKGNKAPTDIELKKKKVEGAKDEGNTKAKKNEITTFTGDGLEELEEYELFLMITDGENDSKVTKISFVTKDMTPPIIDTGYPLLDKITNKSVAIKTKVNEDGTLYYAVMKRGATFPPPIEGVITPPLTSDEAKRAVVTGNNTFKSGKTSVKENVEANTNISGLDPETTYDVYVVAEDKSKNLSEIKTIVVKTTDTIPPKVTQEFEDLVDGLPEAMTEIRLVFSEEVWDSLTGKPLTPETLVDCITLYDMSAPKREPIFLDYSQAKISLDDGKTIVTFPASSRPGNLRSGNWYEFEISNIVDTSGNKMNNKTKLPKFQIVAPLVELIKTNPPDTMDMTFQIFPTSIDTADDVLFDTLLYSDTTIKFELYQRNPDTEEFELITKDDGETPITGQIWHEKGKADDGISIHNMLDLMSSTDPEIKNEFQFEQFNILEPREYGIRITQIESFDRTDWSGTVKMGVRCLIGSKTALAMAASSPRDGYESAKKSGAIEVHYPKEFDMTYTFLDTLTPAFLMDYPNLGNVEPDDGGIAPPDPAYMFYELVGDTIVSPKVRTNKKSTLYYLIAPKGTATIGGQSPTAESIINNTLKPQGGLWGTFDIESPKTEYEMMVVGLDPEKDFDMYLVLKSSTNTPSAVSKLMFRTKEVYPPTILSVKPTAVADASVKIDIEVDKTAEIDWIVYNHEEYGGPPTSTVTEEMIHNKEENADNLKPVASGTAKVSVGLGSDKGTAKVEVKNLKRDMYYTFYAVARSPLSIRDSNIGYLIKFTPADRQPLKIEASATYIENQEVEFAGKPYEGSFILTFSEPAYYYVGEELGEGIKPFTIDVLKKSLDITGGQIEVDGEPVARSRIAITDYVTGGGASAMNPRAGGELGLRQVQFTFRNVKDGVTIYCDKVISDASGNKTGKFYIQFTNGDTKGDGTQRSKSKWAVTINKVQ